MSLTISRRLGLLVAVAIVVSSAVIILQISGMRGSLYQERQRALVLQVESAMSIMKHFASKADKGEMPIQEA
jgi:methyl-accepting chemotaxis protein